MKLNFIKPFQTQYQNHWLGLVIRFKNVLSKPIYVTCLRNSTKNKPRALCNFKQNSTLPNQTSFFRNPGSISTFYLPKKKYLNSNRFTFHFSDPNRTVTLSGKLKIIERREWLAQPPSEEPTPLKLPVPYVIIMHTASEGCFNQGDCTLSVRLLQSFHIDGRKWWDIGYNFMVGGDGYVYEGRGWKKEGAHTYGYNARSIGIAFIGTFNNELPRPDQMKACQLLIQKGVNLGYIQTNYTLFAATQLSQTQSPGTKLYQELTKWPHFALKPTK